MKILNLYAGIGGNRKLWNGHEITAVEFDPNIAAIYKEYFPQDNVIVGDAHEYLLKHFEEFDFIWASPPCQSHSQFSKLRAKSDDKRSGNHLYETKYIDMSLYQEIILLKNFYEGLYCIENVIPYYQPLISAQKIQRHLFWANFYIFDREFEKDNIKHGSIKEWETKLFSLEGKKGIDKRQVLRNCVSPELGLHILECATKNKQQLLFA